MWSIRRCWAAGDRLGGLKTLVGLYLVLISDTNVTVMSTSADPLSATLFSKARQAVLGLLYSHPDQAFYLREIVERTGLGIGQVQREVKQLTEAGIIRRDVRGRHVYFQADSTCRIFEELRSMVTKTVGSAILLRQASGPCAIGSWSRSSTAL